MCCKKKTNKQKNGQSSNSWNDPGRVKWVAHTPEYKSQLCLLASYVVFNSPINCFAPIKKNKKQKHVAYTPHALYNILSLLLCTCTECSLLFLKCKAESSGDRQPSIPPSRQRPIPLLFQQLVTYSLF